MIKHRFEVTLRYPYGERMRALDALKTNLNTPFMSDQDKQYLIDKFIAEEGQFVKIAGAPKSHCLEIAKNLKSELNRQQENAHQSNASSARKLVFDDDAPLGFTDLSDSASEDESTDNSSSSEASYPLMRP